MCCKIQGQEEQGSLIVLTEKLVRLVLQLPIKDGVSLTWYHFSLVLITALMISIIWNCLLERMVLQNLERITDGDISLLLVWHGVLKTKSSCRMLMLSVI